jgi:hypothetical protein
MMTPLSWRQSAGSESIRRFNLAPTLVKLLFSRDNGATYIDITNNYINGYRYADCYVGQNIRLSAEFKYDGVAEYDAKHPMYVRLLEDYCNPLVSSFAWTFHGTYADTTPYNITSETVLGASTIKWLDSQQPSWSNVAITNPQISSASVRIKNTAIRSESYTAGRQWKTRKVASTAYLQIPAFAIRIYSITVASRSAESQEVACGSSVSLSCVGSSFETLKYAWYKRDSQATILSTSSAYTFNAAATVTTQDYICKVYSDSWSAVAVYQIFAVKTYDPLTITQNISSLTINSGASTTLTVKTSSTGGASFLWYKVVGTTETLVRESSSKTANEDSYTTPALTAQTSYTVKIISTYDPTNIKYSSCVISVNAPVSAVTAPAAVSIDYNTNTTLSVVAAGFNVKYQWYKDDGVLITGATSTSYTTSLLTTSTNYAVRIYNSFSDLWLGAYVTVRPPPIPPVDNSIAVSITSQPASSTTVITGKSATLSVTASGTTPIAYQWYEGTSAIAGATTASLTLSNITYDRLNIYVKCSNYAQKAARSIDSIKCSILVRSAPVPASFTTHPQAQSVKIKRSNGVASVNLSFATAGSFPQTYQWFQNNVAYPNATGNVNDVNKPSNLTFTTPVIGSGQYFVKVANEMGTVESNRAVVNVAASLLRPDIRSTTPTDQSCVYNGGVTLTPIIDGGGMPQTYQWYKNSNFINGATGLALSLTNLTDSEVGDNYYYVIAQNSDEEGTLTSQSRSAKVTVGGKSLQTITIIANKTIGANSPFTLEATAKGSSSQFIFKWYRGNSGDTSNLLATQTINASNTTATSTLSLSGIIASTNYWVNISTAIDTIGLTSNTIIISVISYTPPTYSIPIMLTQPQNITVSDTLEFTTISVICSAISPTYQWYQGESGVTNNPVGTNSSNLTIQTKGWANGENRKYWVRITNPAGHTNSNAAIVTVQRKAITDIEVEYISNNIGYSEAEFAKFDSELIYPTIVFPPQSIESSMGQTISFYVTTTSDLVNYQWYKNNIKLYGKRSPSLLIENVSRDDYGYYSVIVSNTLGYTQSKAALLTIDSNFYWKEPKRIPYGSYNYQDLPIYIGKGETGKSYSTIIEDFGGNISNRGTNIDNAVLIESRLSKQDINNKKIRISYPSGPNTSSYLTTITNNSYNLTVSPSSYGVFRISNYVGSARYINNIYYAESGISISGKQRYSDLNGDVFIAYNSGYNAWTIYDNNTPQFIATGIKNPIHSAPTGSFRHITGGSTFATTALGTSAQQFIEAINTGIASGIIKASLTSRIPIDNNENSLNYFTPDLSYLEGTGIVKVGYLYSYYLDPPNENYSYIPASNVSIDYSSSSSAKRVLGGNVDQDDQFYHSSPLQAKISFNSYINNNLDSFPNIINSTGNDAYVLKIGNTLFSGCYLDSYNIDIQPYKTSTLSANFICYDPPIDPIIIDSANKFLTGNDIITSCKLLENTLVDQNLLHYSNQFTAYHNNIYLYKKNGVEIRTGVSNTLSPSGLYNATAIINSGVLQNSEDRGVITVNLPSLIRSKLNSNYRFEEYKEPVIFSIHAKKQNNPYFYIKLNAYNYDDYYQYWPYQSEYAIFDLNSGIVAVNGSPDKFYDLNPQIKLMTGGGGGWYRLAVTMPGKNKGIYGFSFGSLGASGNLPSYSISNSVRPWGNLNQDYEDYHSYYVNQNNTTGSYKNYKGYNYLNNDVQIISPTGQQMNITGCYVFGAQLETALDGKYYPFPYIETTNGIFTGSGFNIDGTGILNFASGIVNGVNCAIVGTDTAVENPYFMEGVVSDVKSSIRYTVNCGRTPIYEIGSIAPSRVTLDTIEKQMDISSTNLPSLINFSGSKIVEDIKVYPFDFSQKYAEILQVSSGSHVLSQQQTIQEGDILTSQISIKEIVV